MTSFSTRRWLGVAISGVAALTLAACGGSTDNAPPSNFAGGPSASSSHAMATSTLGVASGGAERGGPNGSSAPAHVQVSTLPNGKRTTFVVGGGGGSDGGGGGGGNGGGGGGGATSGSCTLSNSPGAHITVCPGRSLHDAQQVRITGSHFKPNENLLFMQCDYKGESANNYGPNDCNINILNLNPNSTKSDGSGNVGPIYLTVHTTFKSINCSSQQCMVTVAVPIQKGDADNPHALIYFG